MQRGKFHDFLLGGASGEFAGDASLAHHEDAVGDLQQFRQLRTHHQNGRTGAGQFIHYFVDFYLCTDVDTAGGFIEEKDAGSADEPLGDDDFLLIAAAETAGELARGLALDAQFFGVVAGDGAFLVVIEEEAHAADFGDVGDGEVVADGECGGKAGLLAIFGDEGETLLNGFAGVAHGDGFAGYVDRAGVGVIEAEESAAGFGAACADESGEADDFAGAYREGNFVKKGLAGEAIDTEQFFAGWERVALVQSSEFAADHVLDDAFIGDFVEAAGMDGFSIAEDGDAITDGAQFFEAVSDIDDSHLAVAEGSDDAEDFVGLAFGERTGGFVEDEEGGAVGNGAADFDQLLAGGAELFHAPIGVEGETVFLNELARLIEHAGAIDPAEGAALLAAEEDVLGDGEMGSEKRFLMHHGNAAGGRIGGLGEADFLAFPEHVAAVGPVQACDDFHQGGLPCPVFAEEQMHLARGHRQVSTF